MLDRILGEDENEDDVENTHTCNDYEVVERGNWVSDHDTPYIEPDGLVVEFRQEVVIECTECGETIRGTDRSKRKIKRVPFESVEVENTQNEDEERQGQVRQENTRGPVMWRDIYNVDGIDGTD